MPSKQDHLIQAEHNEHFFRSFDFATTPFKDWVISGIYYCVLHHIESYLAICNEHPQNNCQRLACFNNHNELDRLFVPFRTLKDASQNARYNLYQFNVGEIESFINSQLNEIRKGIKDISPA